MKVYTLLAVSALLIGCNTANPSVAHEAKLTKDTVEVYIQDGSLQCMGGGQTIKQTAKRLTDKGVKVISSNCGTIKGMGVFAVCGGQTLQVNVHAIKAMDFKKAQQLGFKSIKSLPEGVEYRVCPKEINQPVEQSDK
ncbi:MAG: hypothetical protein ACPGUD_14660 [Parashewanella sp.]